MNVTSLAHGICDLPVELGEWSSLLTSDKSALACNGRLRPHPDNVINIHIISIKAFLAGFKVQHCCKPRFINAPIIKETAVLTELIIISTIIHRGIHIADKHSNTL